LVSDMTSHPMTGSHHTLKGSEQCSTSY